MIDKILLEPVINNIKFYPLLERQSITHEEKKKKISIDQFLKTEEELDVDIYQLQNVHQNRDCTSLYLQIIENKDGYINISMPARLDSGFMEENY